ncbi:unnamed protein product [Phyllotreta striolata]|uniref:Uncharacterized protein n=1 Tax=Phyllotreta striolata TaxID=444603 RepID=A0A9N9XR74_PHYSR|nr:unnamed protein product [Phyllotreta striolata]
MKSIILQILIYYNFCAATTLDYSGYQHAVDHADHKKPIIPILKYITEQSHEGWKYSYESGNGIHAEEVGYIKNKGDEKHESLVQQGTVTYHDEHGHPITLHYVADEHGFRPQGAHLPTPPPVPEDIQKALLEQKGSDSGQIEVNEAQDESDGKDEYEQTQSYAETRLHSKQQAYEPGSGYGHGGYDDGYRRRNNYGNQYQIRRYIVKN